MQDDENNGKEKKKKRSSFGLLKKITRALRPKNSEHQPKKPSADQKKKAVRPSVLELNSGKENAGPMNRDMPQIQGKENNGYESKTAIEEVHEEQMYNIVFYQKYSHTNC